MLEIVLNEKLIAVVLIFISTISAKTQAFECVEANNNLINIWQSKRSSYEFIDSLTTADCGLLEAFYSQGNLDSISRSIYKFDVALSCGFMEVLEPKLPKGININLRIFQFFDDEWIRMYSFYKTDSVVYRILTHLNLADLQVCQQEATIVDSKNEFMLRRIKELSIEFGVFNESLVGSKHDGGGVHSIISQDGENTVYLYSSNLAEVSRTLNSHVNTLTR